MYCNVMSCNLCIYLAPYEYYILLTVVVVSYGFAPLTRLLDLDTEGITVPFSSNGMNRMAYLAHVDTTVRCLLPFV